jgi:pimeloyl-ACP methyl ester carboxylesterase
MGLLRSVARGAALAGAVVAGGALVVTARSVLATPQPLESALEGESRIFRFRQGDIFYKVRGPASAPPILLLHSVHLSASSFEWRRNFSALSQEFRVYAPDLLGFGLSDRPAIDYNADLYVTLITDFAREIIGRPALIVARGQSASFSTRAAYLDPQLFSRLILISPSGIFTGAAAEEHGPGKPIATLRGAWQRAGQSIVGEVPYAFLTTKSALSLFIARQSYANSDEITPDLVRYLFATTHQFGARHAPLAFMTGKLDRDVSEEFSRLQQPVLLVWGEQDAINEPLHAEALRQLNPRTRLELISGAGNAVQDEQPGEINELLRAWFLAPPELVDPTRLGQTVESAPMTPPAAPAREAAPPEPPAAHATPPAMTETELPVQPSATTASGLAASQEAPAPPLAAPEADAAPTPPPAESVEAAASYVEMPTDETPPATIPPAAEPSPEAQAAAQGEVAPEAANQPDLTMPDEQPSALSRKPETPPAQPPPKAAPRRPAAPKSAASRAAQSGGQTTPHPETRQAGPNNSGKPPGSRPSGGKKKK